MAAEESKTTDARVAEFAAELAKNAGVDVTAAERVLRALNVESQIDVAAGLMGGKIDPKKVKLAYRVSTGGVVA